MHDSEILITNLGNLPNSLQIKGLFRKHESCPKNPLLADVVDSNGLIDIWYHGILNIIIANLVNYGTIARFASIGNCAF